MDNVVLIIITYIIIAIILILITLFAIRKKRLSDCRKELDCS